jgi:hypothetical protein
MADRELDSIEKQLDDAKVASSPPVHLWQPPLSGAIDIRIDREGRWYHLGDPIRREALVRLFASILRREEDGHYYLVTPVEKWRITVDELPLQVVDVRVGEASTTVTLNTGRQVSIGPEHPLFLHRVGGSDTVAAVTLENGLAALFSRPSWYQLAAGASQVEGKTGICSGGQFYPIA